jgi:hypothetical protein
MALPTAVASVDTIRFIEMTFLLLMQANPLLPRKPTVQLTLFAKLHIVEAA